MHTVCICVWCQSSNSNIFKMRNNDIWDIRNNNSNNKLANYTGFSVIEIMHADITYICKRITIRVMGIFIIICYIIIFRCHLLMLMLCALFIRTGCMCALHRPLSLLWREGKKAIQQTLPYQLQFVLSFQSRFHVEVERTYNTKQYTLHCIAPFCVPTTYYIFSIIHSFYFFCLFDYVFKFSNSGRFSLIYLPYSLQTESRTELCGTQCAKQNNIYRRDWYHKKKSK